eukprot:3026703-Pleurochrysis_carterae.AAC.1
MAARAHVRVRRAVTIVAQLAAQVFQFVGVAPRQDLLDPCAFAAALRVVFVNRSEHALHSFRVEGAVVFGWVEVLPEAVRPIRIEVRVRRFGLSNGAFLSLGQFSLVLRSNFRFCKSERAVPFVRRLSRWSRMATRKVDVTRAKCSSLGRHIESERGSAGMCKEGCANVFLGDFGGRRQRAIADSCALRLDLRPAFGAIFVPVLAPAVAA